MFLLARISLRAAVLATALILSSGCQQRDAASFVASAKAHLEKSDVKSAIIDLRNALQKDPDDAEARFLLGRALLDSSDPAGAESELRKAMARNFSAERVIPPLARSLLLQGRSDDVIKEFGTQRLATADARAELAASVAAAQVQQRNATGARSTIDAARAEKPDDVKLLLLDAQLTGQSGDLPKAMQLAERALELSPKNSDAWVLKAQLQLAEGDRGAAIKAYESAIEADAQAIEPRLGLLSIMAVSGNREAAEAQLTKLKQLASKDLRTAYAEALVAYMQGDGVRTNAAAQQVLARAPDHLPSLLLSGLANLQLSSYAAAEDSLRRVVAKVPNDTTATRALALVYLRTGRPSKAIDSVLPALQAAPNNATLLRTAGEAYLAAGNTALAKQSFEKASAADKGNLAGNVRLAQVRLATGDTARAFNDLEALSAGDSAANQADLTLYLAHLRRREFDKALAVVDTIEKKQKPSAASNNLRGMVYTAKRDLKQARASFEKALSLQPDFFPAANNLAVIDVQEGNLPAARKRYEQILAKDPKNEAALLAVVDIDTLSGAAPDTTKAGLEKAIAANPHSVKSRLALINFYARRGEYKTAVTMAQTASAAIPESLELVDALGRMQIAAGDPNQALDTYKRLASMQEGNPLVQMRIASARAAMKDYDGAIEALRQAVTLKPDLVQAWSALAKMYIVSGRPEAAIEEARKLQKERPKEALGYVLEGEVLAAQKKWPGVAMAMREALARQPNPVYAVAALGALQNAGKPGDATRFAEQWLKQNPSDVAVREFLAQQSLARKDYAAARKGYDAILAIDPDNVIALNNVAWMLTEAKDPKARDYAEHASRLAPLNPSTLDTLGWSLVQTGDPARGAQLLRMASNIAPAQQEIRLHFARALMQTGDKAGARRELETLTKLDASSPIRTEAERLLATL